MANIKFTNFARTALAVGVGSGDVTMSVTGGTGALFPALTAGQYFYAVLENATLDREIVKVTARSTDTLTVTRGQDNTTARAWVAGDIVSLRLNAAAIEEAVVGTLLGANNLSDVANAATARSNIGALASGDNIGAATATTQTAGDNSTKVATTAYVDASGVAASETVAGKIEIATAAEVQSGTDTVRAITPSGLRSGLNASGSAGIYAVRAWCKFNGTLGGTNAPAGGGNVTNVVTNSTGNYTINFSSDMPDSHFAVSAVASGASATYETARTTSSVTIQVVNTAWSAANSVIVSVQVSR